MARKRMVTRTITTTEVMTLNINTQTAEPFNDSYTLSGKVEDMEKMLKLCEALIEDPDVKVVSVVNYSYETGRYGMPEEDFLTYASLIPFDKEPENVNTESEV